MVDNYNAAMRVCQFILHEEVHVLHDYLKELVHVQQQSHTVSIRMVDNYNAAMSQFIPHEEIHVLHDYLKELVHVQHTVYIRILGNNTEIRLSQFIPYQEVQL